MSLPNEMVGDARLVVTTGVGKSGKIADLAADILQSIGIPAVYISAPDLLHGGLTVVYNTSRVVVIAFSHSGETKELLSALGTVYHNIIAITNKHSSSLARMADIVLNYDDVEDAGPLHSIPTASLVAQLETFNKLIAKLTTNINVEILKAGHPGGTLYKEKP